MNVKVGITQYVSDGKGFYAYWKYSDFQVSEIGMDGMEIHLTDQELPVDVEFLHKTTKEFPSMEQQLAVLTAEEWKIIEDIIISKKSQTAQINVLGKTKQERMEIARIISIKYEGLCCKTLKNVMNVSINPKFENECVRIREPPHELMCTQFVLYKENLSTMEAIAKLATRRHKITTFSVASLQMIKAQTSQLVTAWNFNPKYLPGHRDIKPNQISIGNFSFTSKPLKPSHFKGNHYTIALKQVIGDEIHINSNLESLKGNGFVNYFESECFEINHQLSMHSIGQSVLMEKWLEVANLILDPQFNCPEKLSGKEYIALLNKTSKNAFENSKLLDKHSMENKMIFCLKKFGSKCIHRLANIVSRSSRLNYIRAYQQYVWNTLASKRIAKFGLTPIIGDLVYTTVSGGGDAVSDENGMVLFITEENIHNYTINDILLPLPGSDDTTYPSNEVAGWYTDLLLADGLSDFKQRIGSYNISGEYRLLIRKPCELTWKFVRYDDASMNLILSDLDRLLHRRKPNLVEDGAFLGLVLEFNLPPSTYASMALREIIKMDRGAEFFPDKRNEPSTSIISESSEEPEKKRIKLEVN